MSERPVLITRTDDVAVITLHRPEVRNAVNAQMAAGIVDAVTECVDSARCIVLTGTDPAFCAGLDLRDAGVDGLGELAPFVATVAESTVPVIAAVNGPAVTGGLELALACDFIVASPLARFADTHLRVGVYPGPVLVDLPRRVGDAWAREMSMTGDFIDAETAMRIGLVNRLIDHDQLVDAAVSLASAITEQNPDMVRSMREEWNDTAGLDPLAARAAHLENARAAAFGGADARSIASHRETVIARAHRDDPS